MCLKFSIIFLFLLLFTACTSKHIRHEVDEQVNWSVKLADAAMSRNDSLITYNNPSCVKWWYDIALLGQAIDKIGTRDSKFADYHKHFIDYFIEDDGHILKYDPSEFNLDYFNSAKSLLIEYERTGDEKYRVAIQNMVDGLKDQPRTSTGVYCHRAIYSGQVWINSSYMVEPFLARYAHDFNQAQWFDSVYFQLSSIYELTVDRKDGLLFHAYDEQRQQNWADPFTGKSPSKWGRGMGWYAMALVDVLEFMPADHPKRNELENILNSIAKALLNVRDKETGLWFQVLDKGDKEFNYIETSCSAMFIYALAKGCNLGVLPSKYKSIACSSFQMLTNRFIKTDIDGLPTLTNICSLARLGQLLQRDGSFEYYINRKKIDNDPKGLGPLILAANELGL